MNGTFQTAIRFAVALFFLFIALPHTKAYAQEDSLSPQAQEATNLGMAAAGKQEWELAIKYFEVAQKAAPSSHSSLFNLALAYDKAGKYELAAIAWYRAYLVAASTARDDQTLNRNRLVQERIANLKMKVVEDAIKAGQVEAAIEKALKGAVQRGELTEALAARVKKIMGSTRVINDGANVWLSQRITVPGEQGKPPAIDTLKFARLKDTNLVNDAMEEVIENTLADPFIMPKLREAK